MHKLNVSDKEKREDPCGQLLKHFSATAQPTNNVHAADFFGLCVTKLLSFQCSQKFMRDFSSTFWSSSLAVEIMNYPCCLKLDNLLLNVAFFCGNRGSCCS